MYAIFIFEIIVKLSFPHDEKTDTLCPFLVIFCDIRFPNVAQSLWRFPTYRLMALEDLHLVANKDAAPRRNA
jgi:hypothetical protein